jgi:hypothetical protein
VVVQGQVGVELAARDLASVDHRPQQRVELAIAAGDARLAQDNRKAQDAILEFLRGRDPSRRYGAGFSGAQLKRGLREAGISRRDGEFYSLLRAMVDAGEITRRELNANLTLYYHPTRAPKVGDQLGFDEGTEK